MLEDKRVYRWYVVANAVFGVSVLVISLLSAASGGRYQLGARQLYFDRQILPDHLFYPVVAAFDRIELQLATPERQVELREELAQKRLEAASQLYHQGKSELAFLTLGKAHQYLLSVNDAVRDLPADSPLAGQVGALDRQFIGEYARLRVYMTDSQQASVTRMSAELAPGE